VPPSGFRFTLEEQADLAASLARSLGIAQAVWACPCAGAYVALRVAQRTPELVGALVCAQAPSWEQELAWAQRIDRKGTVRRPWVGQILLRAGKQRAAEGWYRWVAGELRGREITDTGLESLRRGARFPLASALQSVFGARDETFGTAHVPATFVWATDDPSHRHSQRESSHELATHSRIVEFEGSGHFPDLDQPDLFADLVRNVLREGA
jgi:pimeloyl-ACP methyl ester carboxylesterase